MREKADALLGPSRGHISRREGLKLGAASIVASLLPLSALVANSHPEESLLAVAAATLLLLFIGIHNSWDTIAYNVFVRMRDAGD